MKTLCPFVEEDTLVSTSKGLTVKCVFYLPAACPARPFINLLHLVNMSCSRSGSDFYCQKANVFPTVCCDRKG